MKGLFATIIAIFSCLLLQAQNIELNISHVKNKKGNIQIAVFKNAKTYKNENPFQNKRFSKADLKDGCITVKLKLKPGEYGLVLLDDENDSEEMEYNVIGLPKEGFGFAGYRSRGIHRPKFEHFKFTVGKKKIKKNLRVRYF